MVGLLKSADFAPAWIFDAQVLVEDESLEHLGRCLPRGSRYLIIRDLGLKDHDCYGFWGLNSQ